jgi:hypothetical protein
MTADTVPVPEMVLDYLRALVWPAVIVFAVILFREQLARLLERISQITAAGGSVKFGERASEIADEAASLERETGAAPAPAQPPREPETEIVEPAVAFLDLLGGRNSEHCDKFCEARRWW